MKDFPRIFKLLPRQRSFLCGNFFRLFRSHAASTCESVQQMDHSVETFRTRLLGALINARAETHGSFDCKMLSHCDFRPEGSYVATHLDQTAADYLDEALVCFEAEGLRLEPIRVASDGTSEQQGNARHSQSPKSPAF